MSVGAITTIVKVVGVALSAKSAYEGIKEGNIFKAVVGGVGAYYGISSLAKGAALSTTSISEGATNEAANTVAKTVGSNSADVLTADAALQKSLSPFDLADTAANGVAEAGGAGIIDQVSAGASTLKTGIDGIIEPVISAGKDVFGPMAEAAQPAFDYFGANPEVLQTGLTLAGGYMQGKAQDKMFEREDQRDADRLNRRGARVDTSRLNSMQWNPTSRRFEMAGAA